LSGTAPRDPACIGEKESFAVVAARPVLFLTNAHKTACPVSPLLPLSPNWRNDSLGDGLLYPLGAILSCVKNLGLEQLLASVPLDSVDIVCWCK
jgi:hypothetical protein